MAIKKSELYSSLWAGCDELRGGMDASQYKDYVLVLLFIKYVSDKYSGEPDAMFEIPQGGSFKDMQALKGSKDIGNQINMIIGELAKANDLVGIIDVADFADDDKLGNGKEMVDRLTNLISIFENPALDFSKNRAGNDDILGDAYEYLMRHFATESGKSKGQFYTPSEVSRVVAKVLDIETVISTKKDVHTTSFYDPTCGSGSLLLKAFDEADSRGTIYGQEKDVTTAALARMNMILHGQLFHDIHKGQSTLSHPFFKDDHGYLKTFDFIVANPPFSLKNWTNGFNPSQDIFKRFNGIGIPPDKNGDYAFLLHIIKSLKSTGKGACILPHGVLFRGNAEAEIRKNLIERGFIKGIIGLPPNLFYGTGIPACIIVVDKENASDRTHIFMIDASRGFIKDGNKNRLREQDIHKIVDVFNRQTEIPKYSRLVSVEEIRDPKNDYNLNIPRYIDSQETEDIQDIEAHLLGGIPNADIDALNQYWQVYPNLKNELFTPDLRKNYSSLNKNNNQSCPNYSNLKIPKDKIKETIFSHPEFTEFSKNMDNLFNNWKSRTADTLKALTIGIKPKQVILQISEDALNTYTDKPLMDKYDIYQHLMNYWNETMQDDCYIIASDGWKAEPYRILVKNKSGKQTDKGWSCDIVPKSLVIDRYFASEKQAIEELEAQKETVTTQITEIEEEHSGEEGFFSDFDKVNKANAQKRLKAIDTAKLKAENSEEIKVLKEYLKLIDTQSELNKKIKDSASELDKTALQQYKLLNEQDIKQLVVDDKWISAIETSVKSEMERISQRLTQRIKELAERYKTTLEQHNQEVEELEERVNSHLEKMGFRLF